MKRFFALILAITMTLALYGCGEKTEVKPMAVDGSNTLSGQVEYSLFHGYTCRYVRAPFDTSPYGINLESCSFAAESDENILVVIILDVKNLSNGSITADKLLNVTLHADGKKYTAQCAVEQENGAILKHANAVQVDSQATARIYYVFETPRTVDQSQLQLTVSRNKQTHQASIDLAMFADLVQPWSLGQTLTDNETFRATLEDVFYDDSLYPCNRKEANFYKYYTAKKGQTFLIVKMTVEKLCGLDLDFGTRCSVSYTNNTNNSSRAQIVSEVNNGTNLQESGMISALTDETVIYYLVLLPEDSQENPGVFDFYILGKHYRYELSK